MRANLRVSFHVNALRSASKEHQSNQSRKLYISVRLTTEWQLLSISDLFDPLINSGEDKSAFFTTQNTLLCGPPLLPFEAVHCESVHLIVKSGYIINSQHLDESMLNLAHSECCVLHKTSLSYSIHYDFPSWNAFNYAQKELLAWNLSIVIRLDDLLFHEKMSLQLHVVSNQSPPFFLSKLRIFSTHCLHPHSIRIQLNLQAKFTYYWTTAFTNFLLMATF